MPPKKKNSAKAKLGSATGPLPRTRSKALAEEDVEDQDDEVSVGEGAICAPQGTGTNEKILSLLEELSHRVGELEKSTKSSTVNASENKSQKRQREPEKLKKLNKAKKTKINDESGDDGSIDDDFDDDDDDIDDFDSLQNMFNDCEDDDSKEVKSLIVSGLPLGSHVSDIMQNKILDDKFINMSKLLPQLEPPSNTNNLFIDHAKGKLKVKKNFKSIDCIEDWRKAFDIMIVVYSSRKSNFNRIPGMLHYAHEIEGLARDGFDWLTYDKAYRIDRANQSEKPCWSETNQRLYNSIIRKGKLTKKSISHSSSFRNDNVVDQSKQTSKADIPLGFCFAFHSQHKRCDANPCRWSHNCFVCKEGAPPHPIYNCKSAKNSNRSRFSQYKHDKRSSFDRSGAIGQGSGGSGSSVANKSF